MKKMDKNKESFILGSIFGQPNMAANGQLLKAVPVKVVPKQPLPKWYKKQLKKRGV